MTKPQDIYKINAIICNCGIRSSLTGARLLKSVNMSYWRHYQENLMYVAGNKRNVMLHANAATLRRLIYFILWLI